MSHERAAPGTRASVGAVVLAVTPSGIVTARATGAEFPSEGAELAQRRTGFVGRVIRVFGPVARPYLAIRPRRPLRAPEALALVGATLTQGE